MIEVTTRQTDVAALRKDEFAPVPADLKDILRGDWRGPCGVNEKAVYLVIQTNVAGELQAHPCSLCGVEFTFHPEYGWVSVRDEDIRARIDKAVATAQRLNAPGWRR